MLLPDLTPWASQTLGFVYGWTIQGNDLRLTTAMANVGDGRLELRGGEVHGELQDVHQRIYNADGSFTDVLAGTFVFHPEHGHIHFEDFAEYRLRAVGPDGSVGDVIATGEKVSFCLLDVDRYDDSGPSAPYFLTCGQVQGISVGWADIYDQGLPGQSIEITGIPDGSYWLEVVVDPLNNIVEADETNNVVQILIDLVRPPNNDPIPPDVFEPNNAFSNASILAPPEDHTYEDLSIHASGNDDFFRVTASATGVLSFDLAFLHSQGDVDLEVYSASLGLLARSESVLNGEHVSINATAGQFFYVRVYGYNGAVNPDYTFSVDQAEPPPPPTGDLFENNDSFATATTLIAVDQAYSSLSIDAAGDDDYYSLVATQSGTMTVSLAFLHSQGDIDLRAFNGSLTQLAQSLSTTNSEQVSFQVTAGQTYYLRVHGFNGAINPNYTMTINAPEAPPVIPPDQFENNDSFATAKALAAADQTYSSLSIDATGDDDYYSLVATRSGTMTVSLAFLHSQGDIDLRAFNGSLSQLAQSVSSGNSEQVTFQVTAGQTYYLRVHGFNGAINPNYTMTVNAPDAPPVITPDQFENNDSFATAKALVAVDQTYSSLNIDAAGDDDYYSLVATQSGTMTVSLAFLHSQGDIDLRAFNGSLTQLAQSLSTTNSEQVSFQVTAGQTYYLRVHGYNGAINPNYTMTINAPDAPAAMLAPLPYDAGTAWLAPDTPTFQASHLFDGGDLGGSDPIQWGLLNDLTSTDPIKCVLVNDLTNADPIKCDLLNDPTSADPIRYGLLNYGGGAWPVLV